MLRCFPRPVRRQEHSLGPETRLKTLLTHSTAPCPVPQVMYGLNQRLANEDVDSPLCQIRPVKTVGLVVLTGDRGLCGGYNSFIIKKSEARYRELTAMGVKVSAWQGSSLA